MKFLTNRKKKKCNQAKKRKNRASLLEMLEPRIVLDSYSAYVSHGYVEEGDSVDVPIRIYRGNGSQDASITIDYATQGNGAYPGGSTTNADFMHVEGSVTFGPGEIEKTVTVQTLGDTYYKDYNRTFQFVISSANPEVEITSQDWAQIEIVEDDSPDDDRPAEPGEFIGDAEYVPLSPGQSQVKQRMMIGDGPEGRYFDWSTESYLTTDLDFYHIYLQAYQSLQIDIDAQVTDAGYSNFGAEDADSYLRLFDANGIELANNDNGLSSDDSNLAELDSYLNFVAPLAGHYYVSVSSAEATSFNPNGSWNTTTQTSFDYSMNLRRGMCKAVVQP